MKIVFLHIPKTAGQSVHSALIRAYGEDAVCPARVNDQLCTMSVRELNRYQVFSGHLDWSLLDCIRGPKYVFTVLREPVDRILSFYFYLREQAAKLTTEQINRPEHQGMKAAIELDARGYFLGGTPHLRRFLDDHYDNFYTYYFASRRYHGRGPLLGLKARGSIDQTKILELASDNLATVDRVFSVDDMASVFSTIRDLSGAQATVEADYRVNVNDSVARADRRQMLYSLGADETTMSRIEEFCVMDRVLWGGYCSRK